jgi:hypothetical protein
MREVNNDVCVFCVAQQFENTCTWYRAVNGATFLKQIKLKPLEPPPGAQMLREAEMFDVQIAREAAMQHFVTMKARFKSQAIGTSDVSSAPSTGLDTYVDNASSYKKALSPLMKWFDGMEKKSKSSFKDAKPQYCMPMTIG